MRHRVKGFTLIELMVTVAIVAILAAIAYPSFIDQIRKSRRAEGKAVLLQTVQNIERFNTLSNSYATSAASAVGASGVMSEHGYYQVTVASATASSFSLDATPQGGQVQDRCKTLTITESGQKGVAAASSVNPTGSAAECW